MMRFAVACPDEIIMTGNARWFEHCVDHLRTTRDLESVGMSLRTLSVPSQPQPQSLAQQR